MALDTGLLNSITQLDSRINREEIARDRRQAKQIGSIVGNIPGYAKAKRANNWWMQKDLNMDLPFETDTRGNLQFGDGAINFTVGSMSDEWEKYKNDVSGFMGNVNASDYQNFQQLYNAKYADYANKIGFKLQSMENRGIGKKSIKNLISQSPQLKESLIRLDSLSPESGLSNYITQEGFMPTALSGAMGDGMFDPTAMKAKAVFEGFKGKKAGLGLKETASRMFGPSQETRDVAKSTMDKVKNFSNKRKAMKAAKKIPGSGVSKLGGEWRVMPGDTGKPGTQTKASKGATTSIRGYIKKHGLKKVLGTLRKKVGWKTASKLIAKMGVSLAGKAATPLTGGLSGAASLALDAATAVQIAGILKDAFSERKTKQSISNLKL